MQLWAAIHSGAAGADSALLCPFLLLSFADLKSWTFRFLLAFPALVLPAPTPATAPPPTPASEVYPGPLVSACVLGVCPCAQASVTGRRSGVLLGGPRAGFGGLPRASSVRLCASVLARRVQ